MAPKLAAACMAEGLLINAPNASTIRLMPALIVERRHIDDMAAILGRVLHSIFKHVG